MLGRYRENVRLWSDPIGRALFRLRLRPNHLTIFGFAVSLVAAAAFITGATRWAGVLLIVAGLFDLFDGSLARASGQVTAFGAFLDSVIDRYSDLVVLLGIVVLFARTPHARGALVAMAGLVGSVMVSYTKARAESIGVECNVGMMERPERMICLIAGALFDLLEPALWVLAVMANLTAVQRILFTRRAMRESPMLRAVLVLLLVSAAPAMANDPSAAIPPTPLKPPPSEAPAPEAAPSAPGPLTVVPMPASERERAWARAIAAYQEGDPGPVLTALGNEAAFRSPIGDYARFLVADALARRGDTARARATALAVADRHPDSRLAPRALLLAAVLASQAGDEAAAQSALARLLEKYPDAPDAPQALYMLGQTAEARGHHDNAALAYRELMVLAPASAWAEGAADRLQVLARAGTPTPQLSMAQRLDRAERLLRGGVPKTASEEAERIVTETRDASITVRALRVVAEAARRLQRWEAAARALELAAARAPLDQRPALHLEQGRLLLRAGQRERAFTVLRGVAASGGEGEAAEAIFQQARALDDADRSADAAALYRTVVTRYPNRDVAGAALWRLGWLAWLRNDLRGAAEPWGRLADGSAARTYRPAALYWKARAVERLKDRAAAAPIYGQVLAEAPRSYYGVLTAQRLGNGSPVSTPSKLKLPADPVAALANDPGFARVDLLRRVGLVEDAWLELEQVVQASVADPVRLYGFSSAYMRDERYHMGLRILRRHFAGLALTGDPGLPRAFWEMVYPFGWREDVLNAAQRAGLDPYLVAAVVREESSYYPRAISRAGARGLMQLMPGTARPMAEVRGLAFAGGDLLDDPRANLEMGASFLAGLMREFGDPRLALAAYNAGPKRARDWWKARRTDDVEAWVEQIPFDETRLYVKRVMLSWEEYRRIYGGS